MYEIGTIKLTWINPLDYTLLESKMYNKTALNEALKDAQSKPDFMLFELVKTQNHQYEWKLLPYGEADRFVRSMQVSKNVLMPYVGLAIIGFAAYGIYKVIKR
jgi:hypothetical protein